MTSTQKALPSEGTHDVPLRQRGSRTEVVVYFVLGISVLVTLLLVMIPGIVSG
ncbi:hypothetical protein ABH922_003440 [Rhodococcus sp. 27YEA15]|uniref:hypothetical protein n=1 Tax=Rhodococcus sp. 27YEA15 TaxID=3156259 RepID=UPI003C7BB295